MPPFAAALDAWRRETGLSHAAFARSLGITPTHWTNIRQGKRGMSFDLAVECLCRNPRLIWVLIASVSTARAAVPVALEGR